MKTVTLKCGHEVKWQEWGGPGQEDFPAIGHWAFCPVCESDSEITEVDPANYNVAEGLDLICHEETGKTVWDIDSDFDNPEELIEYLAFAAKAHDLADQYAVFGYTVFATPEALKAAEYELDRDIQAQTLSEDQG